MTLELCAPTERYLGGLTLYYIKSNHEENSCGSDLDGTAAAQVLTFSEGLAIGGAFHVGVEVRKRFGDTFRSRPERFRDFYRSEKPVVFVIGDHYYSNGSKKVLSLYVITILYDYT